VLDDSYSMQAGGDDSPRSRAAAALAEELRRHPPSSIRFILASDVPQVLAQAVHSASEAASQLAGWQCRAPPSRLEDAVRLASELGGGKNLILVLTDQAPAVEPGAGRVQWWAFGNPLPNIAFVNASRTTRENQDRCLFEVANLSAEPQTTPFVVEAGSPAV